jgi:hypothetical protein
MRPGRIASLVMMFPHVSLLGEYTIMGVALSSGARLASGF